MICNNLLFVNFAKGLNLRCDMRVHFLFVTVSIAFALCMPLASARSTMLIDKEPMALYGSEIVFDVFRQNKRVGSHIVRFNQLKRDLRVSSSFELSIDVLFFTVYRFRYLSEANWRAGAIDWIKVDVDDNGEAFRLEAKRIGDVTEIQSDAGRTRFEGRLFPTNHWNAGVLRATQVLNTLTGKINSVQIKPRGRERVSTERGEVDATRYTYSGELETEVWYDENGRWVKMQFVGKDGIPIEYVCLRCQGPLSEPAGK